MKFAFIAAEKAQHSVTRLCGSLGVTPSGFYRDNYHRTRDPAPLWMSGRGLLGCDEDLFARNILRSANGRWVEVLETSYLSRGDRNSRQRIGDLPRQLTAADSRFETNNIGPFCALQEQVVLIS